MDFSLQSSTIQFPRAAPTPNLRIEKNIETAPLWHPNSPMCTRFWGRTAASSVVSASPRDWIHRRESKWTSSEEEFEERRRSVSRREVSWRESELLWKLRQNSGVSCRNGTNFVAEGTTLYCRGRSLIFQLFWTFVILILRTTLYILIYLFLISLLNILILVGILLNFRKSMWVWVWYCKIWISLPNIRASFSNIYSKILCFSIIRKCIYDCQFGPTQTSMLIQKIEPKCELELKIYNSTKLVRTSWIRWIHIPIRLNPRNMSFLIIYHFYMTNTSTAW